ADRVAAIGIDARRRRAMKISDAERVLARWHAEPVADCALVHAFARGKEAAAQIGDRTDLQSAQVRGACRKLEMNGFKVGHDQQSSIAACPKFILPPPRFAAPIRRSRGACNR